MADIGGVQVIDEVRGCGGVALGDVLHDDIAEAAVGGGGGCVYILDNGEQGSGLAFLVPRDFDVKESSDGFILKVWYVVFVS